MSVNSRNTNHLLNQQIALLKQVSSSRTKSMTKSTNQGQNDSSRPSKFYNSQNNPLQNYVSAISNGANQPSVSHFGNPNSSNLQGSQIQNGSGNNNILTNLHGSQNNIILPSANSNNHGSSFNIAQNLQQQLGNQPSYRRDHSNIRRRGDPSRKSDNKINLNNETNIQVQLRNSQNSFTPDIVGGTQNQQQNQNVLYQQIRNKNNQSALSQSFANPNNPQQQQNITNKLLNGSSQLQLKEFVSNNSVDGTAGNISGLSNQNRKSALLRYQQQFQSQKRGSSKGDSSASNKNSMRNTKTEQFFNSRGQNNGGNLASKENLKQVIKIYKEGLKDDGQSNSQGNNINSSFSGNANLKSNLMGNIRNMSVPRGSQQKSYMLSSQDYALSNSNAYYQSQQDKQKTEAKLPFSRQATDGLNSSVAHIKLADLSSTYGIDSGEKPMNQNLNETAPLITGGVTHKQHSLLQGTLRTCNCPCNCQLMQHDTQSQTTHQNNMMSILSGTQNRRHNININNTMTLRIGQALNTTTGQQTTTVMLDEPNFESTNIEDMHHLMVNVEKIKRKMLGRTEGQVDLYLDYTVFNNYQAKFESKNKSKSNNNGMGGNKNNQKTNDELNFLNSLEDNSNLNVVNFE